jgi:thiosulfate/3-mercaptopyruvate sulfurtransferase
MRKFLTGYATRVGLFAFVMVSMLLLAPLAKATEIESLVSVDWLKQHANDPNIVVLDIRDNGKDYIDRGHIPGARLWDMGMTKNLVDLKGIDQVLSTANGVADLLGKLGVRNEDTVVLTDNGTSPGDVTFATRAYWSLRYYGVSNVAILDGGTSKWASENLPLSHDAAPSPTAATFQPGVPPVMLASAFVGVGQAYAIFSNRKAQFIDARPTKVFVGDDKPPFDPKYGHIPGAVSWPVSELLNEHASFNQDFVKYYTFKNKNEIESSAREHHINLSRPSIVYCDTGHLSSGVFFAWREILKKNNLEFFPGSMKVWGEENLPAAKGE